jgi:hypothetical protein
LTVDTRLNFFERRKHCEQLQDELVGYKPSFEIVAIGTIVATSFLRRFIFLHRRLFIFSPSVKMDALQLAVSDNQKTDKNVAICYNSDMNILTFSKFTANDDVRRPV